jgi:hypothetical protein
MDAGGCFTNDYYVEELFWRDFHGGYRIKGE